MPFRRPLVPCVLAYITGLWLVHDVYHHWPAAGLALLAVAILLATIAIWKKHTTAICLLGLLTLGAMVMGIREHQANVAAQMADELDGPGARLITGTVTAISELADAEKSRVLLKDVSVVSGNKLHRLPGKTQLTLESGSLAPAASQPVPGVRLAFPGRIRRPTALNNFFGYDRMESLRHEAIYFSAVPLELKGIVRTSPASVGIAAAVSSHLVNLRKTISHRLTQSMWQREGRLMVAMLFNDMRSLTEEEKQIFRESGTFHLFAVSGMHVAILALVLNLLFRALRFGIRGSWICTAVVLFFYLWLIDFVPSATRSYLMLVAFTFAYMLGREVDAVTSLVLAITAVVAFDPASPWKAGFVLSVIGVASIILFTPLLRLWFPWPGDAATTELPPWKRHASAALDLLMATLAVSVVMLPLQVYYFGFWNLLAPLANLLQAALSGLVLSAGVFAAVSTLAGDAIAQPVGQAASLLMRAIYEISLWAAQADWAFFYASQLPTWLMLICYGIIFGGYYLVFRDAPEFSAKSRARFATHACCGLGLMLIFQLYADWRKPGLEIWCLDVGQGDATLIRFPNSETMLIDGGRSEPDMGRLVVLQQLRGLGIKRIDYIVATHDDDDHTGGLATIIETVGCRYLLVPQNLETKSAATARMMAAARRRHCIIQPVATGYSARAGDAVIEVLGPEPGLPADTPDNDRSVVLRLTYGRFSALLMGDASTAVEDDLAASGRLGDITMLKTGHHGSKTSTGAGLLSATRPEVALISCGANNRFGHPSADVLQRLNSAGARILRTDFHGAACIQTNGFDVRLRTRIP